MRITEPETQGWNQQTYERLQIALSLNLRRQVFIAVCDNLSLRNHLAQQLEQELLSYDLEYPLSTGLAVQAAPKKSIFISLELNTDAPNLIGQIAHWFAENLVPEATQNPVPKYGFQILGIERLTRHPLAIQQEFLNSLKTIGRNLPSLEFSVLLWVPRPWLYSIKQSAPEFWRCHTGLFEFISEPSLEPEELPVKPIEQAFQGIELLADREAALRDHTAPAQIVLQPAEVVEAVSPKLGFEDCLNQAYRYREQVAQGENTPQTLYQAIAAYEQVLEQLGDDLSLLPDLLNDLGNFYWLQSRLQAPPEAVADLEQAIACYETALAQLGGGVEASVQMTFNRLQNNLGTACSDLARYREPAQNLQKAIAAHEAALSYRQIKEQPEPVQTKAYALAQNNLGTAYWNLAQHQDPKQHLKNAIAAYQQAQHNWELTLQQEDSPANRLSYGMIHNNLGTTYWNLAQYEQPEHYLLMAVWSYQIALQSRTPESAPSAHAATQNNLGTTYWHLAHCPACCPTPQAQIRYLDCCIQAYKAALATVAQLTHPVLSFDRFATHHNLGLAYKQSWVQRQHYRLQIDADVLQALETSLEYHIQAWNGWQNQPEQAQTALNAIVEVIRSLYNEGGLSRQNAALAKVPPSVLPEILRRL